MTYRLLDLYCSAGGGAAGYRRGGWDEIVGVDKRAQPHYPYTFVQRDALGALVRLLSGGDLAGFTLHDFHGIHASPPCQAHSALNTVHKRQYPELVEPTRDLLRMTGKPYVIENVPGAPLIDYVVLCAGGLGLGDALEGRHLQRHRLFELSFPQPGLVPPCSHWGREAVGVYGHGRWQNNDKDVRRGGYQGSKAESARAMDIDWMTMEELAQAIPPAMTEFLAPWLLAEARAMRVRASK